MAETPTFSATTVSVKEVVILRFAAPIIDEESVAGVGAALKALLGVPILILEEGATLESLDEAEMAAAGWVRAT